MLHPLMNLSTPYANFAKAGRRTRGDRSVHQEGLDKANTNMRTLIMVFLNHSSSNFFPLPHFIVGDKPTTATPSIQIIIISAEFENHEQPTTTATVSALRAVLGRLYHGSIVKRTCNGEMKMNQKDFHYNICFG